MTWKTWGSVGWPALLKWPVGLIVVLGAVWFGGWASGCQSKGFNLPHRINATSQWGQAGGSAAALAFDKEGPEPPLSLLWKTTLNAPPLGQPLIGGDLVWQVTTGPAVYVFDRRYGQKLGKRRSDDLLCGEALLGEGWLAVATIDGDKPGLRVWDTHSEHERWRYPDTGCARLRSRGDTLWVVGEDGWLAALNARNGEQLWKVELDAKGRTPPALGQENLYMGDVTGVVRALSLSDGEPRWTYELNQAVRSGPAVDGGMVYVGTASGRLVCLDEATGAMQWQRELGSLLTPGIAVAPQMLVVGAVDRKVYGVSRQDGALVWEYLTEGVIRGTPATTGGTTYCGSSDSHIYALETATGRLAWKYRLDGPAILPVALGPGLVAITTEERTLYVFGRI